MMPAALVHASTLPAIAVTGSRFPILRSGSLGDLSPAPCPLLSPWSRNADGVLCIALVTSRDQARSARWSDTFMLVRSPGGIASLVRFDAIPDAMEDQASRCLLTLFHPENAFDAIADHLDPAFGDQQKDDPIEIWFANAGALVMSARPAAPSQPSVGFLVVPTSARGHDLARRMGELGRLLDDKPDLMMQGGG